MKTLLCALWLMSSLAVSAQQALKLTYPNGGEQLVAGTDVEIRWEGVSPQDTVVLEYSVDSAKTWNIITKNATNLKYAWRVPNEVTSNCFVRANLFSKDIQRGDWAKKPNGNGLNAGYCLATDNQGNIYMGGQFNSPLDFGNGISINSFNSYMADGFLAKYTVEGNILWSKSFGGSDNDRVHDITVDSSGNIYIAGDFRSPSCYMGNGITLYNFGSHDCFVAKYTNDGNILWARQVGGNGRDEALSVTVDQLGNVYTCGYFSSPDMDFGKGIILKGTGPDDSYIAKYDSEGGILWAKKAGLAKGADWATSITTDLFNNIYVCGHYRNGIMDFDNGDTLSATDDYDCFIAKYDSNGNTIWSRSANGNGSNLCYSIKTDTYGNILVAGYFNSSILDFGSEISLQTTGDSDFFIAKFTQKGEILWAVSDGGSGDQGMASMVVDQKGDAYIGGDFSSNTVSFPDDTISGGGGSFVAKFDNNGKFLWANRISGGRISSVQCDNSANVYICGTFRSPKMDFWNGIQLENLSKRDRDDEEIFIAKYGGKATPNQSDTSNATFSIFKPEATSLDINMGKVLLSFSKDSVIKSFIHNTGNYPIRIDSIALVGNNASDFQISLETFPFIIAVGDEKQIECSFIPKGSGIRTANITIFTQADTIYQKITGEGIYPIIEIQSASIDFGGIEINSTKDSVVTAIFRNTGIGTAYFKNSQLFGADKDQFEIISGGSNFILQSGEEHSVQLRFKPTYVGIMSAQISFEYNSVDGQPAIVQLLGRGLKKEILKATVFIPDVAAYSGEKKAVTLKLKEGSSIAIAQQKPTAFKATIAYHKSILSPFKKISGATFLKGMEVDTLNISANWNGTSTELTAIPFTATLGDRTETPLELLSFHWLNNAGEVINSDTELQNGVFKILGICEEGGTRLYDVNGKAQMMMIAPHPANGVVEITFETVERGATTLMLTDVLGQQIVLKSGDFEKGAHSFEFDTQGLASGIYILTMQTPTQVFTQQVIIGK